VVRAQHLDLSGQSIEGAPMIEGRVFTVEATYIISSRFFAGRGSAR
jgi:hypothetical protein